MSVPQRPALPEAASKPGYFAPLLFVLTAAALVVRGLFLLGTGVTFEDSFISLRYAEHLAAGLGMVYNPGEPVFGATTPLYVGFLAGLLRLGLPALPLAKLCTALADTAVFFLWARWLFRSGYGARAVLLFFLLFGLSPLTVQVSVSGMETSFALLLVTLALQADLADRPGQLGAALGALMLVRPDGALAALVILGLRWRREGGPPWRPALVAALFVLPWLYWATLYYGTPVPHSIPAKAAAYNIHRPSLLPNFFDTLAHLAPIRWPWGRALANVAVFPCLIAGLVEARRDPRVRPIAVLFLAWWAYLVLPKTLLFTWYFPPLVMPAYVLAAVGLSALSRDEGALGRFDVRAPRLLPRLAPLVIAGIGMAGWVGVVGYGASRIQHAEWTVRRNVGLWLRDNTPPDSRIAMEPIGYIGYYSERRILDEVGLVSPEMVPLNRAGDGWFARMVRELKPDYIVERPGYLLRNDTLNSDVTMFRSEAEREEFVRAYAAVARFGTTDVPRHLENDYRFIVYERRSPESLRQWQAHWTRLGEEDRQDLLERAIAGPDLSTGQAAEKVATPRP